MLQEHFDRILSQQPAPQTLGELLERARIRLGITQAQVAGAIGVSQSAWNKTERQNRLAVSMDKLLHAAEILEIDPYEACFLAGVIHPDMEERLLGDWKLYDELRNVLDI